MLASFKAVGDLPLPFPTLFISKILTDALFPLSISDRSVRTFYFIFCLEIVSSASYLEWDQEIQRDIFSHYMHYIFCGFICFEFLLATTLSNSLFLRLHFCRYTLQNYPSFWLLSTKHDPGRLPSGSTKFLNFKSCRRKVLFATESANFNIALKAWQVSLKKHYCSCKELTHLIYILYALWCSTQRILYAYLHPTANSNLTSLLYIHSCIVLGVARTSSTISKSDQS